VGRISPPIPEMPALQLSRTPRLARRISRLLAVAFALLPVALVLVPWTQNVHGVGRAIAFNPVQRPQFVVSPIEGRIKKWSVVEGDRVRAGQRIVELVDNDPNLELRLLDEERAILDRLRAGEGRVIDIESRVRNLENSRQLALAVQASILRQEQSRVEAVAQSLIEAKAALDAAVPNYERVLSLNKNPKGSLASDRDVELAKQAIDTAKAKYKQAEAQLSLAAAGERAASDNLKKVDSDTAAMINLETASKRSAQAEVAGINRDKAQIETRIARQRAQYVDAPCNGTIFRLLANAEDGGILVKAGERLAVLVPDVTRGDREPSEPKNPGKTPAESQLTDPQYPGIVAELFIDGNDLPLIRKGDRVRLQFEGWPAVQFVGWPSVAVGTFGGRVYLIDPTTNDKGQFRLLVEPDPSEPGWPNEDFLRQGVRAQGWILLDTVAVGWEFWRNLNGFPAIRERERKNESGPGPVKKVGK
jgi:adhesin transport system membrane fusion protein